MYGVTWGRAATRRAEGRLEDKAAYFSSLDSNSNDAKRMARGPGRAPGLRLYAGLAVLFMVCGVWGFTGLYRPKDWGCIARCIARRAAFFRHSSCFLPAGTGAKKG